MCQLPPPASCEIQPFCKHYIIESMTVTDKKMPECERSGMLSLSARLLILSVQKGKLKTILPIKMAKMKRNHLILKIVELWVKLKLG